MNTMISLKPARLGSISSGTLKTADLLSCFISELEDLQLANAQFLSLPENSRLRNMVDNAIGDAQDAFEEDGETVKNDGSAEDAVNTCIDALNEFAPAYAYFGAHEGDGSCFGFWPAIEVARDDVGFVSSRNQDYPEDDFRGEWLHVNDHGNATLYVRGDDGEDVEIWSVV